MSTQTHDSASSVLSLRSPAVPKSDVSGGAASLVDMNAGPR
jgi:hypothetical protein